MSRMFIVLPVIIFKNQQTKGRQIVNCKTESRNVLFHFYDFFCQKSHIFTIQGFVCYLFEFLVRNCEDKPTLSVFRNSLADIAGDILNSLVYAVTTHSLPSFPAFVEARIRKQEKILDDQVKLLFATYIYIQNNWMRSISVLCLSRSSGSARHLKIFFNRKRESPQKQLNNFNVTFYF